MTEREKIGPYVLYKRVGDGGMGTVHLAKREQLGVSKWVAIKTIHPHLARRPNFVASFLDEARVAAALNHPNVTQVFEFNQEADRFYLAMEYVHGENLSAVLAEGPLEPRFAAKVVALACDGLEHAHGARDGDGKPMGLVHRDVSPQNIFLTYEGHVKVTDFGIAFASGRRVETKSGHIKGKVTYMAPEQVRGKKVDRRTDVFALGIVLAELLTGDNPFSANTDAESFMRITQGDYLRPSAANAAIPEELDAIVTRALSLHPDDRFATARQMGKALDDFLVGHSLRAGPRDLAEEMARRFPAQREEKEAWLRGEFSAPALDRSEVAFAPTEHTPSVDTGAATLTPDDLPVVPRAALSTAEHVDTGNAAPSAPTGGAPSRSLSRLALPAVALVLALAGGAFIALGGEPTASIQIASTPNGAIVTLDGERIEGTTPLTVSDLPFGAHDLVLQLDGHADRDVRFNAESETLSLEYALAPATAVVEATSTEPPHDAPSAGESAEAPTDESAPEEGASEAMATAGESTNTMAGSSADEGSGMRTRVRTGMSGSMQSATMQSATMQSATMQSATMQSAMQSATMQSATMSQSVARGRLTLIATPTWARVRINGEAAGQTPLHNKDVPAGRLRVELQQEGQGPWVTRYVNVPVGGVARLNHRFQ